MAIRLCYFDVDETLVDPARHIPPSLDQALVACRARGVVLGLATGRMYAAALPYAQAISATAPLILYNGARVCAPADGAVLYARTLELQEALRALELVARHGLHVNLYLDDEILIERESEASRASARKDGVRQRVVGELRAFLDRPPTKLLIIGAGDALDALRRDLEAKPLAAELVRSEPTYLELLPDGVSKGAALTEVSRLTGVPLAEIAAFGDSNNDLELLETAGLGVAVANALDNVKAVADYIASKPNGDGVAEALHRYVLGEGQSI